MSERAFKNPFPDYKAASSNIFDFDKEKLNSEIEKKLLENIFNLLKKLEKRLSSEIDWDDTSVYTGTTGIAMLYLHFMDVQTALAAKKDIDFLKEAFSLIEPCLSRLKHKRFSFLCGSPGPLSLAAILFQRKGLNKEAEQYAKICQNLHHKVYNSDIPDELLYGRCGFLYALLLLEKQFPPDEFRKKIIKKVVQSVISSGEKMAKTSHNAYRVPLYYEWHEKAYVGAAHGFIGIMYMMLQAREHLTHEQLYTLVQPTIDFVLNLQMPSGNFPSSLGNSSDKLLHWCHGAPGCIHLLLLAYEVYQNDKDKYLEAAVKCSNYIWQYGILQKGYGICHGVAGNGYAHLRLFQVTQNPKYLYRAVKFAEWCFDYGKHGCRSPDRPLSLFEGLAGTIYYLLDLLDPLHSAFPALQLF